MKETSSEQKEFLKKIQTSDLNKFQELIDEWIRLNGGYWEPLSMFASIIEETGEIAREINHLEKVKLKKLTETTNSLELELGDLLFSIICLANYYKIDLSNSIIETLQKYTQRDWKRFNEVKMK